MTNQEAAYLQLATTLSRMISKGNPKLEKELLKNTISIGSKSVTFSMDRSSVTRDRVTGYR